MLSNLILWENLFIEKLLMLLCVFKMFVIKWNGVYCKCYEYLLWTVFFVEIVGRQKKIDKYLFYDIKNNSDYKRSVYTNVTPQPNNT